MKKIKLWHISDTHTFHNDLIVPENIDIVIHSGDATNPRDKYASAKEMLNFLDWYGNLLIGYRIYVGGNHDLCLEKGTVIKKDFEDRGIIYLEGDFVEILGLKIWGGPWTPTFGDGWAFNRDRAKISRYWDNIPLDTDVIITHGPPKCILDLSYDRQNKLEYCGDKCLLNAVLKIQPKLHCFGHIHQMEGALNAGYTKLQEYETIFSNGSVVTDRKFGEKITQGNLFEL